MDDFVLYKSQNPLRCKKHVKINYEHCTKKLQKKLIESSN